MKKLVAFISSLLVLGSAVFADVSVKKLDNGKVEVTFFYGNPRATEVLLAGDFTSWQDGAEAMTKTDKGFTLTKVVPAGTIMKYKFISDGNWTEDMREPDKVDDGFGGHNGLVDVDELTAALGGGDGAATKKSGVKFQTWSNAGFQTVIGTNEDAEDSDTGVQSSGIGLKSYWKFGGNVTPHVPVYVEVALAENESFDNLYSKGTLQLDDGLKNAATDVVFDTIYWTTKENGSNPYLGHFKTGIETPYVNWTSGFKYAKLPPHSNVNWTTIDKEWEAGYSAVGGYNVLELGAQAKEKISALTGGLVQPEIIVAPNRSADRAGNQYGMYAIVDATINGSQYVDFQYNGAYGSTYDTIFDNIYETDLILGYKGSFGPVTIKANGLMNMYGSTEVVKGTYKSLYNPASSDVGLVNDDVDDIQDNMAANVNVTFSNDLLTAMAGYRFRGEQANMMYVEEGADDHTDISDQLGDLNTQRIFADVAVNVGDATVGVVPYLQMNFNKDSDLHAYTNKDTMEVVARPKASFNLENVLGIKASIDGYAEVSYETEDADKYKRGSDKSYDSSNFVFNEAGLHFNATFDGAINSVDVIYGFNGNNQEYAWHNVVAAVGIPYGINVQAGVGYAYANKDVDDSVINPFGFSLGANKQICKAYKTILHTEFCYNYDPYKDFGDQWFQYNLDDYIVDRDEDELKANANLAKVRIGVSFDF